MTEMKDETIHNMRVVEQHGREIGAVEEVLVDTETWIVSHLKVALNRNALNDLKLRKPLFGTQTVRIPSKELAGAQDVIVLKRKLEDLEFDGGVPSRSNWASVLFTPRKGRGQSGGKQKAAG